MKGSEKMVESWSKGKGWREALTDGLYKQQIAKREDLQKERMLKLAQVEDFQFDDLGDELRAGLKELEDGMTVTQRARLFADKMSGGTYSDDIEKQKIDIERRLRIIDEFSPHEKRIPKLLHKKARKAIADKLGLDVRHVSEMIFTYQLHYAQWSFLRREYLRGRKLPDSPEELEWRLQQRPSKEYVAVMKLFMKHKAKLEEEANLPAPGEKPRPLTWIERYRKEIES
jgi:hypothetical protein